MAALRMDRSWRMKQIFSKNLLIKIALLFVVTGFSIASNILASDEMDEQAKSETRRSSKINYSSFFKEKPKWCSTMVINCSDFRFSEATQELINNTLGLKGDYDYFAVPGSIRNMLDKSTRKLVLDTFGISVRLHNVKRVVIIAHQDCVGYGGSKVFNSEINEYETMTKDLKKARSLMKFRFRHLQVYLFYGTVKNNGNNRVYRFEQVL
ncbi:MAG: hypothetical protein FJ264_13475 [Planctomycetes bacterium]|nr:hypothetical protein [Planctomycetota bacterium]